MTLSPEERELSFGPNTEGWYGKPDIVVMPHLLIRTDTTKEIPPLEWNIFKRLLQKLIRPECIHIVEHPVHILGSTTGQEQIRINVTETGDQNLVIQPDYRGGVERMHFRLKASAREPEEQIRRLGDLLVDMSRQEATVWDDRKASVFMTLRTPLFSDAQRAYITEVRMMHYVGMCMTIDEVFGSSPDGIQIEGDVRLLVPADNMLGTMPDLP